MAVFPFIPVVAYTLIISAFSYISARILKHFKFSSDLLAFLRRKGRLAPLPITHSHELLPTSTASSTATPLFGMYAASSNVTPRTSLDALPVLPPRLISPASSPPGRSQLHRVTETPLPSFSVLEPTLYRHKQRRSRSLGVPTPRPQYWTSQFPPSPPVQQDIVDGRRRNSEEDIPLAFLSRGAEFREPRGPASAPVLHEPPTSAPVLFMPDSSIHSSPHGPLVDISPLTPESTSSSSRQAFSIAGPSYSSSESSPQSSPFPDSNSLFSSSRSNQSSDIGVQPVGGLGSFAYDWGFDRINLVKSPQTTIGFHESSSMPLSSDIINDVVSFRGRTDDSLSGVDNLGCQDTSVAEGAPYDATESALVQVQCDLTPEDEGANRCTSANPEHSTSAPSTTEGTVIVTYFPPLISELVVSKDTQIDDTQAIVLKALEDNSPPLVSEIVVSKDTRMDDTQAVVLKALENNSPPLVSEIVVSKDIQAIVLKAMEDNKASHEGGTILEKPAEVSWDNAGIAILPPLPLFTVENSDIQERPLIAIDTTDLIRSPRRSDSLSARSHSSPMSPSQTPTPPASPPFTSIQVSKGLAGVGKSQLRVAIVSPISEPASPIGTKDGDIAVALSATDPQGSSVVCRDDVQQENGDSAPAAVLQEAPNCDKADGLASPACSDASPTCSTLPEWPERAADAHAQSLGMSTPRAALEQEEALLKTSNVEAGNEGVQKVRIDEEITMEQHAQPAVVPVEDQENLPGTFPMSESIIKNQGRNLSASSTAVVTVSGTAHRRQIWRELPIDVALAMQMRPGLGVGADPAWMVRFLMAVFGWFAVMIAGRGGEVDVYAL